jgi:hypothetical protein
MPRQPELFPKTVYCIDTSSLINLKLYRRDVFPTIWGKLENMIKNGELISHMEVYKEIEAVKDMIYNWCKNNKRMFKDADEYQIQKLQEVKRQYDNTYWENEINKTSPWADPWLIALGICEKGIIVADEKNVPNRIPVVSAVFGVKCLALLDFFKEIGIKY